VVSFETILNVVWLCAGLCALGVLAWSEREDRRSGWKRRAGHLVVVSLAIIFLFPCVSESDDLMTLAGLPLAPATRGGVGNPLPLDPGGDKPVAHLERFFESLQTFRIPTLYGLLIALLLVAFVVSPGARASERWLPAPSGRAPPPVF
jgi:hypothetical protein